MNAEYDDDLLPYWDHQEGEFTIDELALLAQLPSSIGTRPIVNVELPDPPE